MASYTCRTASSKPPGRGKGQGEMVALAWARERVQSFYLLSLLLTLHCGASGCPLWVISGQTIPRQNRPLSALVQKRTNGGAAGLSAKCQKRTNPPQQTASLFNHLVGTQLTIPTQFWLGGVV